MKRKCYWSVVCAVWGADKPCVKLYRNYQNAKAASKCDYHDKPILHTVKPENYPPEYAFED